MPFTVSHAAAVIPLRRSRFFIFSALVVGSMAPDFEYFVCLSFSRGISHSWTGLFTFCLPAGLVVLGLFHGLLKRPLLCLLPVGHRRRLEVHAGAFPWWPLSRLVRIVVSMLAGILSHLVWDAFTHLHGFGVRAIPLLAAPVYPLPDGAIRVCDLLQLGCSVLGAIVVLAAYIHWYRNQPAPPAHLLDHVPEGWQCLVLAAFLATACVIGAGYGFSVPVVLRDANSLRGFGGRFVSAAAAVVMAQSLAFSMAYVALGRQRETDL